MGLDITICVTNPDEVFTGDYADPQYEGWEQHSLSRAFCNFMRRRHDVDSEREFDQIGRITMVDIEPIYAMELTKSEESPELDYQLYMAQSQEEKQNICEQDMLKKQRLAGNIEMVLATINALIDKLSVLPNLSDLLNYNEKMTGFYEYYFNEFNIDKGDGYLFNNFGQDLRNFKRFLEFAKSRGTAIVYFDYG